MLFLSMGLAFASNVFAGGSDNVGGFAWSENIGWISFNNTAVGGVAGGGGGKDYGVKINPAGDMSGYAWSENIGWISFNEADLTGCPSGACKAKMATAPAGGKYAITGWARVLSVKDQPSNISGGWGGWIKLDGTYVDSNGDLHGFAWSDMVLGWMSFNSANCDGVKCTANKPYKVHTSFSFGPLAKMSCGGTCPGGYCDIDPNSTWTMYPPVGNCYDCIFSIANDSEGAIGCTKWELIDSGSNVVWSNTYSGKQNLTFWAGVPLGVMKLQLTVSDNADCSLGNKSVASHALQVKREAQAKIHCTFDNPDSTSTIPFWQDCDSSDFKGKVVIGETIYAEDDGSVFSEDAGLINSREWTFTVDGVITTASGQRASFVAGKSNKIKFEVVDNSSRSNCKIIDLGNVRRLPKWQEVSPVGMVWNYLAANISKLFVTPQGR